MVTVGIVLVVAGFAFKIAAVPFHAWAADVYQGAPIPVAALLSVISKAAGFAGLILVLVVALPGQAATWVPIIAIVSALTMTVGNLLAMRQRSAVRLLAWSSVAQSGYILAPLAVASGPARTRRPRAVGATVAYLVIYAAMNLGAFAVVMLVSRTASRNELDDYRGLVFRSPAAGLALAFCLICLAGLPPGLAGLFAKIVVFREIVDGGAGWLAVVMAVNTVIGLYYYVAWTARLFTPEPGGGSGSAPSVPRGLGGRRDRGGGGGPVLGRAATGARHDVLIGHVLIHPSRTDVKAAGRCRPTRPDARETAVTRESALGRAPPGTLRQCIVVVPGEAGPREGGTLHHNGLRTAVLLGGTVRADHRGRRMAGRRHRACRSRSCSPW